MCFTHSKLQVTRKSLNFFRDIATLQAGMGDKVACFIQWVSCFIVGAIVCLVEGWQLTLVILSVAPVAALSGGVVSRVRLRP